MHRVLALLLNQADAFEHIGDVIDPPFLNAQVYRGLVQVNSSIGVGVKETDKLLGKSAQARLIARLLEGRARLL